MAAQFDGFNDDFSVGGGGGGGEEEPDPAAEFLAREQNQLAGLDDEDDHVNYSNTQVGFDDFLDIVEPPLLNGSIDSHEQSDLAPMHLANSVIETKIREEPEKIKKWREEQKKRLEEKDADEELKKSELRESAKHELEEWYKHHLEQIEKTRLQNREACKNAEKEYVMDRDSDVPGQEWERIAKLCDFNPKASKHSKDVSRMRSIILQLKQTPVQKRQ